ncbi:hypothetical protein BDV59DRAFT_146512 [Aspergillus ambiguus]|uniref:uncharacterized protein n=1 Tax=Aspergillus ambiguus TaxID=176160 RepID=UPI003CCD2413
MPIFQDPDRQRFYDLWSDDPHPIRNHEQSSQGPYREGNNRSPPLESTNPFSDQTAFSSANLPGLGITDREGLIRYIKTADTTWPPSNTNVGHRFVHTPSNDTEMSRTAVQNEGSSEIPPPNEEVLASPAEIERPRSALHSGDFREGTTQSQSQKQTPQSPFPSSDQGFGFLPLSSSPTTPWFTPSVYPSPSQSQTRSFRVPVENPTPIGRSRAPSLGSFSSSYVLKTPTSPLVYQANNTDLDFSSRTESVDQQETQEKINRRRTLPPEAFARFRSSSSAHQEVALPPHCMGGNWNEEHAYQPHHHPRRSLTSAYSLQLASSFQSPFPRARRPSLTSEVSSKPHAPMVGSYEESILRGRMSMYPSKPLDFTAQIGVLGKGKCKSNLKCPPHVTVPFPAVFYSYPTSGSGRSISDDSPSPYVGLIDLDNNLPRDISSSSRRRRRHASPTSAYDDYALDNIGPSKPADQDVLRKREKRHRRAESPRSPPGGCYRIPQQGQLQIIIKNPNKTAVKLFLVPYDLSDMEPGTKTFIRQRSYSAGPIIDMPLNARKNYGTDRPEASLSSSEDPNDKPVLRYLIHLNICCPSRGRFYLHSSARVVFANRVPDGKEKLRNEIQHPDPRYTPYKPTRDGPSKALMDRTQRHMTGTEVYPHHRQLDNIQNRWPYASEISCGTQPSSECTFSPRKTQHPFQPIPSLREEVSPVQDTRSLHSQHDAAGAYNKLNKGDAGYGGYPSSSGATSNGGAEVGESLLAKRLRGLDVQRRDYKYIN